MSPLKIHVLPVPAEVQPWRQSFRYPPHNHDYGVEQDYVRFLARSPQLVTSNPSDADWHYLPVYWTRWHLNHDYGRDGVADLQAVIDRVLLNDERTFTICQYDDGPVVNVGGAVVFRSSRRDKDGIDIPLLSSPHRRPLLARGNKHLASFIGRLDTHPIRERMAAVLGGDPRVFIRDRSRGTRYFVRETSASYVALSPRGYGGSSFRLFEAMQLGVAPLLLSDIHTRPFKRFVNWDSASMYASTPEEIPALLAGASTHDLLEMGRRADTIFQARLGYQRWCELVAAELESLQ